MNTIRVGLCLIVFVVVMSVLGCRPMTPHSLAEFQKLQEETTFPYHRYCDDRGVSCYSYPGGGSLTCTATRVELTVLPGGQSDNRPEPQSGPPDGGEVSDRALKERILKGGSFKFTD